MLPIACDDGDRRIPWLCSQADLLATDWHVVN